MTAERSLTNVRADVERTGLNRATKTGRVAVSAIPSWLKDGKFVRSSIGPARARRLAIELLMAAEDAERKL